MGRSPKAWVAALAIVAVAGLSTPAFAGSPAGPSVDSRDYEPAVLTLDDVRRIPGLAAGEPYTTGEQGLIVPGVGDTSVPTICGGASDNWGRGARVEFSGAGASGPEVSIESDVGTVEDAKKALATVKSYAKNCKAPYNEGRFAPAARQPKVKKVGDGVVAFAATSTSSGRTIQQVFVREGRFLISYVVVASAGADGLKDADLNRLAKTMANNLAALDRKLKQS